jgi:hypothetical protein
MNVFTSSAFVARAGLREKGVALDECENVKHMRQYRKTFKNITATKVVWIFLNLI